MPLNRRSFLAAAGVTLALPALDAMGTGNSKSHKPPGRMVMICTSLGLHSPHFFPTKTGRDYDSPQYIKLIERHRQKFTLFSGLSHPDQSGADGHSSQMTWLTGARHPGLGGFRNSISIDQVVRQKLGFTTRFPSINLGTDDGSSQSYTNNGVMVPAEWKPSRVFQKMFLTGNQRQVAKERNRLRDGQSILDLLDSQINGLNRKVSSADRDRLAEYYQSIRAAEKRLHKAEEWLDVPKPKVDANIPDDIENDRDLIGRANLMMSLIPLMVQTDSTRMITMLIQGRNDVPIVPGVEIDHHNLSHHGQDETKLRQLELVETEIMKSFGRLLDQLVDKNEGENQLLDNTMICFGSNLGNANSHDWRNLPIIVAGGDFNHGQHVKYDTENNRPLSNLFLAMMRKMNLEITTFSSSNGILSW